MPRIYEADVKPTDEDRRAFEAYCVSKGQPETHWDSGRAFVRTVVAVGICALILIIVWAAFARGELLWRVLWGN